MKCILFLSMLLMTALSTAGDFNSLEENLVFKINWPGADVSLTEAVEDNSENTLIMTTVENERYKCILPLQISQNEGEEESYVGPSALELLNSLFSSNLCIFKLEQYWGYELCHGKHLRQFHEDKETGKEVAVQEFFLGRYSSLLWTKDVNKFNAEGSSKKISHVNVDGQKLPYVEVLMTDGTTCDLNGNPRQARIKYACSPDTKHQIFSIEESSICEYEVLVLTRLLCSHPSYNLKVPKTNEIHCHAIGEALKQPAVLEALESESYQLNPYSKLTEAILKQFGNLDDINPFDVTNPVETPTVEEDVGQKGTPYDSRLTNDILSGDQCLNGGSGWWKYEFCYGKKVEQYHVDSSGSRIVNSLGTWNKEKHMKWIDKHPHKKANRKSKQISQLYSDGDLCTETLKPRQVEVQLRCKESPDHLNAVSMSLLEPSICDYILIVESPIFCHLITKVDDYGLLHDRIEL
ncbi:hypothetical protein CHUAL_010205 [Chamberlinius hualienensis]